MLTEKSVQSDHSRFDNSEVNWNQKQYCGFYGHVYI